MRLGHGTLSVRAVIVSIHAPGRGATKYFVILGVDSNGFQFTHPGGVRHRVNNEIAQGRSFNSRTREGCDMRSKSSKCRPQAFQFTHPGGVRHDTAWETAAPSGFNSRTREGCDGMLPLCVIEHACFNSRTREGCDCCAIVSIVIIRCFNSRTREGCDCSRCKGGCRPIAVSIHAPGRGATLPIQAPRLLDRVSIHAPGRGATCLQAVERVKRAVSIHAPGRGATPAAGSSIVLIYRFQFTHPGGVRLCCAIISIVIRCFNSRTREGCDGSVTNT